MRRLLLLATVTASLAVPSLAQANTYCVNSQPCVDGGGTNVQTFGIALLEAKQLSPGQDRIELGSGDFTSTSGFTYTASDATDGVDIVGAGPGQTRLLDSDTNDQAKTLELAGAPASSVSGLTIVAPSPFSGSDVDYGLDLSGTAHAVAVEGQHSYVAVKLRDGSTLTGSTVTGSGGNAAVENGSGSTAMVDTSTIDGEGLGVNATGGTLTISRTRIQSNSGIVASLSAAVKIDDTLIETNHGDGLAALGGASVSIDAVHTTIVGHSTANGVGITAGGGGGTDNAEVTLTNSIVTGYPQSIVANQLSGNANVKLIHSDYDKSTVDAYPGRLDASDHNSGADPGFVDANGGDYHLTAGSPLIDAGLDSGIQVDLDGAARSIDGDGDGTATPDVGALESPVLPPPPAPVPPRAGDPPPPRTPTGAGDPPPVITALTIGRKRFKAGTRTAFRVTVSEDSHLRIALKRVRRPAGSLTRTAHAGSNKIAFRGRIQRHALRPGRYVATAQATNAAGQRSSKRTVRFKVLAPRRRP